MTGPPVGTSIRRPEQERPMVRAGEVLESAGAGQPPLGRLGEALGEAQAARLSAAAEAIAFEAGQRVIEGGAAIEHLYLVGDGVLSAEVPDRHGVAMEVRRFVRGDYAGEMAFLQGERASATVRALTPSTVWRVPHVALREIANESPALMRELCRELARRLSDTNARLRQVRRGRVVALGVESRAGGEVAAAAIAMAARLLGDPVVLIDQSGLVRGPGIAELAEIVEGGGGHAGPLEAAMAFARSAMAGASRIEGRGPAISEAALIHLLGELRTAASVVVVCGEPGWLRECGALAEADSALVIEERSEPSASEEDIPVVLLRPRGPEVAPARLPIYRKERGRNVIRVVPRWPGPVDTAGRGRRSEPGASISWLARHILARKVGIALGAGGSKGYAHLGALEALEELGVEVDYIVGCSIGAPLATGYVHGVPFTTARAWLDRTFARSVRLTIPYRSLLSNRLLRRDMEGYFDGVRLEDQPVPIGLVAVDLDARREIVFRRGPAARAIVASMAIPGIYPPVRIGGRRLVDGGLLNPVPIRTVAAAGADVVIAVKLTSPVVEAAPWEDHRALRAPPIVDTIQHAFEVMQWRIVIDGAARADVTVEPLFRGATGLRDYARSEEFIEAGRAAVEEAGPSIRRWLPWVK